MRLWEQAHVLAQQVGTGGMQEWIKGNIVPAMLMILGVVIFWKGKSGDNAGSAKVFGPLLMGAAVLGLAITGGWEPVSRFVVGLFVR